MALYNSKLVPLIGTVDSANKGFSTPTRFVADSIKVMVNGQVYEPSDNNYGWTETSDQSIEFTNSPWVGDILQAFYQDLDSEGVSLQNVVGSPFDPTGVLP